MKRLFLVVGVLMCAAACSQSGSNGGDKAAVTAFQMAQGQESLDCTVDVAEGSFKDVPQGSTLHLNLKKRHISKLTFTQNGQTVYEITPKERMSVEGVFTSSEDAQRKTFIYNSKNKNSGSATWDPKKGDTELRVALHHMGAPEAAITAKILDMNLMAPQGEQIANHDLWLQSQGFVGLTCASNPVQ